nr:ribonuclease p protein subunit p29 [Quercus suber]
MGWWKKLWKLEIPNKVKNFVWRTCKEVLPTKANLSRRKIVSDGTCDKCRRHSEDSSHALFFCSDLQVVWASDQQWQWLVAMQGHTAKEIFKRALEEDKDATLLAFTSWAIWNRRNQTRSIEATAAAVISLGADFFSGFSAQIFCSVAPFSSYSEEEGYELVIVSMATETAIQDPRKHALEALKRRTTSLADKTDAAVTPSFGAQHKKDPEENAPAYLQLSQAVHENLLATNIKLSSRKGDMVDKILHELLQNGDMAQKYMQKSRKINIDHFVLLDNYVQGRGVSTGSHIRALRMHSKRSKKHMSVKQHKKCGSFDLPQELHKYDVFRPMHEMWKGYMMQLLETVRKNQLAQCLLNADLHGAFILGVSGIMIRETAETFGIITQDGVFRETQRIYLGPTLMELQESTKCVSSDISDGPIPRFVKIKFYENIESSSS